MELNKTGIPAPTTAPDDPRFGNLIGMDGASPILAICGFCSDNGVAINGGRTGAAEAPDLIRAALWKLTPDPEYDGIMGHIFEKTRDFGNFDANKLPLDEAQNQLGDWVASMLGSGLVPVILGGGHETSYGHFLGYANRGENVTIINWDAHADVRPLKNGKAHSGSPFRQAIEHGSGCCKIYIVAGLQRHSFAASHKDWLLEMGSEIHFREQLTKSMIEDIYFRLDGDVMVTMDMDALDQTIAPGVSAPAVNGMTLDLWFHAAFCAGANPNVKSFDLVEFNPTFDIDNQTARVAALTVWHFFRGFALRWGSG